MSSVEARPPPPGLPAKFDADCSRCTALCCIHTTFSKSADFAIHKPAGVPCPHLAADHRCRIHDELRPRGFGGCVAFDCYGAGQRVTARKLAEEAVGEAFWTAYGLCELGWHLEQAQRRCPAAAAELREQLSSLAEEVQVALDGSSASVELRPRCSAALAELSAQLRPSPGPDLSRKMLLGEDLRRRRLRRASLVAACLVGADLRGVDLRGADLRGADLRGADLRGADLRGALFLTRTQLASARLDGTSRLPED